ncbi:hypothetical protein [Priestia megaterium]|uniref:hypothetical protein n=1 Tax=Priestia megaterium TaxID=1404 RepID=UPI0021F4C662|nr:hypothetical protein [Priestia megaterium]UYP07429.1 hypothetical protein OIJ04_25410 [Priestia megaterium]
MNGYMRITTKTKDIIEGTQISYKELETIKDSYPLLSIFENKNFKDGLFIVEKEAVSFIHRNQIEAMSCLKLIERETQRPLY